MTDTVGNCRCSMACAWSIISSFSQEDGLLRILMAAGVGDVNSCAGLATPVTVEITSRSVSNSENIQK